MLSCTACCQFENSREWLTKNALQILTDVFRSSSTVSTAVLGHKTACEPPLNDFASASGQQTSCTASRALQHLPRMWSRRSSLPSSTFAGLAESSILKQVRQPYRAIVVRTDRSTDIWMSWSAAGASRSAALAECCRQLKGVRSQTLKWLQSCIEAKDSGPLIRAKAVKSLSAFIRADSRLLANRQVAACFDSALKASPRPAQSCQAED